MSDAKRTMAPWSPDQVNSLNEYQKDDMTHEYTCSNGHTLLATQEGWKCPYCTTFEQKWAMTAHTQGWQKTKLLLE